MDHPLHPRDHPDLLVTQRQVAYIAQLVGERCPEAHVGLWGYTRRQAAGLIEQFRELPKLRGHTEPLPEPGTYEQRLDKDLDQPPWPAVPAYVVRIWRSESGNAKRYPTILEGDDGADPSRTLRRVGHRLGGRPAWRLHPLSVTTAQSVGRRWGICGVCGQPNQRGLGDWCRRQLERAALRGDVPDLLLTGPWPDPPPRIGKHSRCDPDRRNEFHYNMGL